MNSSQMPLPPRTRIGWRRPSQRLKSPTTLTRSALGGPNGEKHAGDAIDLMLVCAEKAMGMAVSSFPEQMQVQIAELRRERVGIMRDVLAMAVVTPDQAMVCRQCPSRRATRRSGCRAVASAAGRPRRC